MGMLLRGRTRNGREGIRDALKDTVEVQTPGLAWDAAGDDGGEVTSVGRSRGRDLPSSHPPGTCGTVTQRKSHGFAQEGVTLELNFHLRTDAGHKGWDSKICLCSLRCAVLTEPFVPNQAWQSPPFWFLLMLSHAQGGCKSHQEKLWAEFFRWAITAKW